MLLRVNSYQKAVHLRICHDIMAKGKIKSNHFTYEVEMHIFPISPSNVEDGVKKPEEDNKHNMTINQF